MSLTQTEWEEARENEQFAKSLGDIFRPLRGSRGQKTLAREAGVSIETVRRIEQGRAREITLARLVECARAVGVEPAELVRRARSSPTQMATLPMQLRAVRHDPPIGREEDRRLAIESLEDSRGVVLFGAPGQGKTTLARYVAAEIGGAFRHGVCEVDLESERQVENLPRLIAAALGQADLPSSYELLRGRSLLLILDSVDQMLLHSPTERFRDALSAITRALASDGRVIITCQRMLEKQELVTREVCRLRDDAAVELFHRMSDNQYRQDSAIELGEFVRDLLDGHALSIRIVARYGRVRRLGLDILRRLWEEKWSEIAEGPSSSLDDRGLRASFELTFDSLSESARLLFLSLSLLPDGMPSAFVKEVWSENETEIYNALAVLRERSLLEEEEYSSKSNRLRGPLFLFAAAKLCELKEGDEPLKQRVEAARVGIDAWFDRFIAANAPQFGDSDPRGKNQLIRDQFHNIHASLDRRLSPSTEPATIAAAQGVLSLYWAYHNNLSGARNPISSTEDAIRYLEKAQAIFVGNGRSADATRCIYYIGNIHWLRGDIAKARSYLHEAQCSDDVDEEISCEIQRAFAHIDYKESDIRAAVDKFRAVAERAAGREFWDCVFRCWVGLLDAYRKLDQLDVAFELMNEIRARMDRCPVAVVGNVLRAHAYLLASDRRYEEAAAEYNRAIAAFSHNDFGQAHCWRGLGDIHVSKGELDAAETAFTTAMWLYDEARKNPSLGVALVMLGRGKLELARDNSAGALEHFGAAAQLLDREHLDEPYEFAVAHELMGEALAATGDDEKARAEFAIARNYFSRVGATAVADRILARMA